MFSYIFNLGLTHFFTIAFAYLYGLNCACFSSFTAATTFTKLLISISFASKYLAFPPNLFIISASSLILCISSIVPVNT